MSMHDVLKRPLVTEKGITKKESEAHACASKSLSMPTRFRSGRRWKSYST